MSDLDEFEAWLDPTPWEPAPGWLQAMADAVARDLGGDDGPLALSVRFARDPEADYLGEVFVRFADGEGGGFSVGLFDTPADQLARVADSIQGEWCESSAGWAQARPACPGHPHPARAVADDGAAWWSCPDDGRRVAPIGATAPAP